MASRLQFLGLPPELLMKIVSYLPARDVSSVCQSCKKLLQLADQELVWQNLIKAEFNIRNQLSNYHGSYKDVYTKILYEYKNMLGLWQPEMGSYGGLLHIKLREGKLIGEECFAPIDPDVYQNLRIKRLFSIQLSGDLSCVDVLCYRGFAGPHPSHIEYTESGNVKFRCSDSDSHKHPEGKQSEFESWLVEETGQRPSEFFVHGQELLLMKFLVTTQLGCTYDLTRVHLPPPEVDVVIQPGLFKGNYGGHGIELIMLEYLPNKTEAHGKKITGDPNVPANKISLYIDLTRPMVLSIEQQRTIDLLQQIDIPDLPPDTYPNNLQKQSFRVPDDCFERFNRTPTSCIARFHANGQIAGHDYSNPSQTPGHWVVFNENTFGFLWLELKSFSLYSRVTEEFD
ncbi:F-box only protein 31 [Patella vulgata]|uniref:F-box only protein 31 n=1 Tax=Patella vulgata TaxID=6465 RepID=UPI0021805B51|nr:F-box only protein 31 [Patella vulgata]